MSGRGKVLGAPRGLACLSGLWHTPHHEEGEVMTERQQENWSGVLLALMVVGFLLGGWLILRVMVH